MTVEANTANSADSRELDKLFAAVSKNEASDLHLKSGSPPLFRLHGKIVRIKSAPLTDSKIRKLVDPILTPELREQLRLRGSADFSYAVPGVARFRINVFYQRGYMSMAARRVETKIPTINELNLPPHLGDLSQVHQGLILAAGVTGSGKSTTLAAILQMINQERQCHIVTIEDPIEYTYTDEKAIVNQREVGIDVPDFAQGLRYVLRQDPDVILIGEMRDAETFETALMAAETGHLVFFGTVHARAAAQTIGRILDYFPAERHKQIRQLLYFNLKAVIVQKLVPSLSKENPRVPAVEILVVTPIVQKLIAENEDAKIAGAIRNLREQGMQDFNQSLLELVNTGLISEEMALQHSLNPEQLRINLKGIVLNSDEGAIVS